jgi:hypothetical protein
VSKRSQPPRRLVPVAAGLAVVKGQKDVTVNGTGGPYPGATFGVASRRIGGAPPMPAEGEIGWLPAERAAVVTLAERRRPAGQVGAYTTRPQSGTAMRVHGVQDLPTLRGWLPTREFLVVTESTGVVIVNRLHDTCIHVNDGDWVLRAADGRVTVMDDAAFTRWWKAQETSAAIGSSSR